MNATEFYRKNHKKWLATVDALRVKYFDAAMSFAEAYAASETARADQAEAEIQHKDNYFTNAALEVVNANERVKTLEAEIQRKDAALRSLIERSTHYPLANRL